MQILFLVLMWLLNFGISIWNAYAVGKSWVEARAAGGWPRIMCWSGAVMSASGFSWCYLILVALILNHYHVIDETQLVVALNLGYILLIPGILLSGLMITLDSWGRAFRQGGFLNYGAAVYNTYAQIHNTYSAITNFGDAFRNVSSFFGEERGSSSGKGDRDNGRGWIVIVVVIAALAAGVLTTAFIIRKVAGTTPLPPPPTREQFEDSARNVARTRP